MVIKKWNGNSWVATYPDVQVANIEASGARSSSTFLRGDGAWAVPNYSSGDITGITAGSGLTGGGSSGTPTLNVGAGTGISVATDSISIASAYSPNTAIELSSSQNLNDITTAGFYYQTANADTSGNNYPSGEAGSLLVQKSAGLVTQTYTTYTNRPKLYQRSYYTSWSSWVRIFNDDFHPNADILTTARNIALTGAVTGNANFNGSANISIATTATADPTLTLSGDASGSATFTNLGNATLTVTVADDSHNHIISNVDGLQTALNAKANLSSPALTGTPTAPTAAVNTNTTQIATTAYVQQEITDLIGGAPGALDTLNEIAAAINDDSSYASTITTALAGKMSTSHPANNITSSHLYMANGDGFIWNDTTNVMYVRKDGADSELWDTSNFNPASYYLASNPSGYTSNVGDITGVTAGSGISGGGTSGTVTINHADTSTQASVNNSGRTYIQDITLDTYGHITGITSATETVVNTDTNTVTSIRRDNTGTYRTGNINLVGGTNVTISETAAGVFSFSSTDTNTNTTYTAGGGLTLSGTTFSHTDTSTQGSVNNSGATFIQDVTLDTYGHTTGLASVTITPATIGASPSSHSHSSNAINVGGISFIGKSTTGAGTTTELSVANAQSMLGLGSAAYVASSTFASSSHSHAASAITSGTIATARLASGTASSSTYLRGDSTWATIPGGGITGDDTEWAYVGKSSDASTSISITVDSADLGSSYDWANYDYKFVYQGSTTGEDTSTVTINFDGDTSTGDKYSYQYYLVQQTAETTETESLVGDAKATGNISTGLALSSFSSGGFGTDVELEFTVRRSLTTGSGLFGFLVRGEGNVHYWPTTQSLITARDGMAQTRFVGSYRQDAAITSVTVVHGITAGGTDVNVVRVYRRRKF